MKNSMKLDDVRNVKKKEQAVKEEPVHFYAERKKIYPRKVKGTFANLRKLAVFLLLGLYYGLPWIRWDGQQALLFDLPARKFHVFGLTFWPQDFFYLALLLIAAGVALFFFTALAGRLWCGYACPQTVWTEVFIWMEQWVEGDRNKQIGLDKKPWSWRKLRLKSTKQFLWVTFSLFTGFTFVGYFTPILELGSQLVHFDLGPWETFWILFYSFATYGNAGWMREQVCLYMCPYARFQSAMFDKDTLVISYDQDRGEPRGRRSRKVDPAEAGLGSCIDCNLCVQVCPTGIDIRDGLQYECIGCAACIDVCDEVMDKMDYPRGLIKYTTESAMNGEKPRILRARIWVYGAALFVVLAGLIIGIANRSPLELDVLRDRNSLYRETNEGLIENIYSLRLINKDNRPHLLNLSVLGIEGVQLIGETDSISLSSGEYKELTVKLRVDPVNLDKVSTEVVFTLESIGDTPIEVSQEGRFLGKLIK